MVNNISQSKIVSILENTLGSSKKISHYEYMFNCPFCGISKSNKPHFGINFKINAFNCFRCGKSGRLKDLLYDILNIKVLNFFDTNNVIYKKNIYKYKINILYDISDESKKYISSRIGDYKIVETIIKNNPDYGLSFIDFKGKEYISISSVFGTCLSLRCLDPYYPIKKIKLKLYDINDIDFFCICKNKNSNRVKNLIILEGIFDMITHLIYLSNVFDNLFYIITNGKIIFDKIDKIIKLYFDYNNVNLYIYKDYDVSINNLKDFGKFYNTRIIYFDKSRDLNDSFINFRFNDMKEVKL